PMPHVLVIDDDRATCTVVARLLQVWGHETRCAFGGAEGLAELERFAADVVVLDLMMPEMDGVAVLTALRADERYRELPVILLTALADGPAVREAHRLGIAGSFLKASWHIVDLHHQIEAIVA